jgi:alanine dehydrogenase
MGLERSSTTVRVLSDEDIAGLLDLRELLPVIEDAFVKHARGAIERPDRPHFPVGAGLDPDRDIPFGTALTMPAYIHSAEHYVTKLVSVHEDNVDSEIPTVNAQIALTDAATGLPVAYMAGTRITNARTGCIGGLAARELGNSPVSLGVLGAGAQARWQARAIDRAVSIERIRIYSPSDSKYTCADDLEDELGVPAEAVGSPAEVVTDATVVVTATTAETPVFSGEALDPGTLVIAVGAHTPLMQELDATTMERAARVFADVPGEVAEIGDIAETGFDPDDLLPFSELFIEGDEREDPDEIIVVNSVGSAVLDAATAEYVFETADELGVGEEVFL